MSHNLSSLREKTLPVFFAQGYIHAFWKTVSMGPLMVAYELAASELFVDKPARQQWLAPLLAYILPTAHAREPLDYRFIALLHRGLELQYKSVGAVPYFKRAGREWWFGAPPISTYQDQSSLHKHFAPHIWAALNPWKFGAPGISSKTVKSYHELGVLAVTTFFEHFQHQSGIDCKIAVEDQLLTIEITECPFCLPEHGSCYVFTGIVEGLLAWLHGDWVSRKTVHCYLTINEQVNSRHQVVINVHPMGYNPATAESAEQLLKCKV